MAAKIQTETIPKIGSNVRFGFNFGLRPCNCNVCSSPMSRHRQFDPLRPKSARNGLGICQAGAHELSSRPRLARLVATAFSFLSRPMPGTPPVLQCGEMFADYRLGEVVVPRRPSLEHCGDRRSTRPLFAFRRSYDDSARGSLATHNPGCAAKNRPGCGTEVVSFFYSRLVARW